MKAVNLNTKQKNDAILSFSYVVDEIEKEEVESLTISIEGEECYLNLNGKPVAILHPRRDPNNQDVIRDISESHAHNWDYKRYSGEELKSNKNLAKEFWSKQIYYLFNSKLSRMYSAQKYLITSVDILESIKGKPMEMKLSLIDEREKPGYFDHFLKMAFKASCSNGYLMPAIGYGSDTEFGIALSNGSYQCEVHPSQRDRHIAKNGQFMSNMFAYFCEKMGVHCSLELIELDDRNYHNIAHCFSLKINVNEIFTNYDKARAEEVVSEMKSNKDSLIQKFS